MSTKPLPPAKRASAARRFTPASPRARHDGWTAQRQTEFIEALAECACVDEACRRVGMSPSSAYTLRRRPDAASFRQAWDHALDYAVRRLADAAFARALHGVARPVFYQGEQIGERRHFDERLTMFLLRYRDPARYGAWLDRCEAVRHPEGAALTLAKSLIRVDRDAFAMEQGRPVGPPPPMASIRLIGEDDHRAEQAALREAALERADEARRAREWRDYLRAPGPEAAPESDSEGDVA